MNTMRWRIVWRRLKQRMKEARPAGILLGGLIIAWLFALMLGGNSQDKFRHAGWLLEMGGLLKVIKSVTETPSLFNRPNVVQAVSKWFGDLFHMFDPPRHVTIKPDSINVQVSASSPRILVGLPPDATAEQQLKWLIERVEILRAMIRESNEALNKRTGDMKQRIDVESADLRRSLGEVSFKLEQFTVGELSLEVVGLTWLIVGITISSFGPEIAAFLESS